MIPGGLSPSKTHQVTPGKLLDTGQTLILVRKQASLAAHVGDIWQPRMIDLAYTYLVLLPAANGPALRPVVSRAFLSTQGHLAQSG